MARAIGVVLGLRLLIEAKARTMARDRAWANGGARCMARAVARARDGTRAMAKARARARPVARASPRVRPWRMVKLGVWARAGAVAKASGWGKG